MQLNKFVVYCLPNNHAMKYFLSVLLLFLSSSAIAQDYKEFWIQVERHEDSVEIKQAAAITNQIYALAKKDRNEGQLLKIFFYRAKYMMALEEDAQLKVIEALKNDLGVMSIPGKAIMESLYAEMLANIYYRNSYKIDERSYLDTAKHANFTEWSGKNFREEIAAAYRRSIANREILYKTPLTNYSIIVEMDIGLLYTKRSLYDFLAERYLNANLGYNSIKNSKDCLIESLFGTSEQFQKCSLNDTSQAITAKKLETLRDMEHFYMLKKDTYSLQRAVLRRLHYVNSHHYSQKKDALYSGALIAYAEEWGASPFAFEAKYHAAKAFINTATYPGNEGHYKKAMALCNHIIANAPHTSIKLKAKSLKEQIMAFSVSMQTAINWLPGKPELAYISFRNIDTLLLRIYKVSAHNAQNQERYLLPNKKPFLEKNYVLKGPEDYRQHTTEIILPGLPQGHYIIVALPKNAEPYSSQHQIRVNVAKTTLVTSQGKDGYHFRMLDKVTGKPIKKATIVVNGKTFTTNTNGKVLYTDAATDAKIIYTAVYKGDTITNAVYYSRPYNETKKREAVVTVLTDRAIYRPGQTVHFKAVAMLHDNKKITTVPDIYLEIYLTNEDDDELAKLRLKTNEFGSVSGEFKLPENGPTGEYAIRIDEDSEYDIVTGEHPFWDDLSIEFNARTATFNVEEYKRPTFEVTFEPVKGDVIFGKELILTGVIKSFSGAPVPYAKVSWNIERYRRNSYYDNLDYSYEDDYEDYTIEESELLEDDDEAENYFAKGTATTDAEGNFKISFTPRPDRTNNTVGRPVFTYAVTADVTDNNGETRSATKNIYAGYHSVELTVTAPASVKNDESFKLLLNAANLNGEQRNIEGTVEIYKMTENTKTGYRPWPAPEIQSIDKEEFEKTFPDIPYLNFKPERSRLYLTKAVNTAKAKDLTVAAETLPSGNYQAVFTAKDSLGREISSLFIFTVLPSNEKPKGLFTYELLNKVVKADEKVKIKLQSSTPRLYVNILAYSGDTPVYDKLICLMSQDEIRFSIPKNTTKPVTIVYYFAIGNRFYRFEQKVEIPVINNELHIETESIIDKLQPGSPQQWKFTIKGDAPLPAEVLAAMYDASLDKFRSHYWANLNQSYRYDHIYTPYFGSTLEGTDNQYYAQHIRNYPETIDEDRIYNFGFDINNSQNVFLMRSYKKQVPDGNRLEISGIVYDMQGLPIPGVFVSIRGSDEGTQTDFDGAFTIYATKGDNLVFSMVGMNTSEIAIGTNNRVYITLKENEALLEEVVVVGYGVQSRERFVGTATTTSMVTNTESDIVNTLRGAVAGINIESADGVPGSNDTIRIRGYGSGSSDPLYLVDGTPLGADEFKKINIDDISNVTILKDAAATAVYGSRGVNGVVILNTKKGDAELKALQNITARKKFNETAFFKPQLKTDNSGKVAFSFETPEALTQWRLMMMAHNSDGGYGYIERTFTTSKDLMVVPNMPRFLRENDTIVLMAKITNLTAEEKTGTALLRLSDAMTMQPADAAMMNLHGARPFTVGAKGTTTVNWKIIVPYGMQAVQYKIVAQAGNYTDGEENILPILSNSMLVTESIPLWVKPNTTKTYTFENLKNNISNTLRHHGITVEYTSNPAWAALQSLPYLMEYQYNCAEQIFSRYYANVLALHIINSNPNIAEVFAEWRKSGITESKLMQSQELKSALLAETPWLLDGLSDIEAKNRIALLFEFHKVKNSMAANLKQLDEKQSDSGGFPWFEGGEDNEFITMHIVAGFGHLDKLGVQSADENVTKSMVKWAIGYLDKKMAERHKKIVKADSNQSTGIIPYNEMHALYARSFYLKQHPLSDSLAKTVKACLKDVKANWKQYSLYEKGLAALTLYRFGDIITSKRVITSLRETASNNEEWGMYWIENKPGWYWHNAPIETQALLIEAFTEIDNDNGAADAMKVWLLKQKQNKNWPTTKATTEAVYALLMKGSDWLSLNDNTIIKLGSEDIRPKIEQAGKEAGTGYVNLNWKHDRITKDMSTLSIENKSSVPGYGGFYLQYFEDLDKVKPAQAGLLDISRNVYRKVTTAKGIELEKPMSGSSFKIGDLLTIRLVIKVGEDMEFVHLKDIRASAFEPVDVLSGYHWKGGLGFYKSTRDAATHFFFDKINRGTYVLEYGVRVNNEGDFSSGVSTIQSMYAPEFSGHSRGERIKTRQ